MQARPAVAFLAALMVAAVLSGCVEPEPMPAEPIAAPRATEADDAVVVAVLDFQFDPYHLDFLARTMPQHTDDDAGNDLPLSQPPHTWLPGFPDPSAFASYTQLDLTLPTSDDDEPEALYGKDEEQWQKLKASTGDEVHLGYIPGTKAVGVVTFAGSGPSVFSPDSHGVGTSSVSVGNLHGSCPECLFVFVNAPTEAGFRWVTQQPWIDAMTNSYGAGSFQVMGLVRDNIYDGCDLEAQRLGVERGQQIFFSGGNGFVNAFDAPPQTLWSCQKGPDWIVTVGATTPDGQSSYTGHGKPVDVAAPGSGYPSAGGATVTDESTFSGTSNAAPVTAGLYAAALKDLRDLIPGPSRIQQGGVIATGTLACGELVPACATADGQVTVHELREALYRAATPTEGGFADPATDTQVPAHTAETELWTEGHGSFRGTLGERDAEVQAIVDFATGHASEEVLPMVTDWMVAYSYCAQGVWGEWDFGAYNDESTLPPADPEWPYRTFMATECPTVVSGIVAGATTVSDPLPI